MGNQVLFPNVINVQDILIIKLDYRNFIFSSLPLASSWTSSPFSLIHQKCSLILLGLMHYIPCICIEILHQLFSEQFPSLWELILDPSSKWHTHLLNLSYFPQRSLEHCQHFLVIMDTTSLTCIYLLSGVNKR